MFARKAEYAPPVCPECGSKKIVETMIDYLIMGEHDHNPNKFACSECLHRWRNPCPICGGIVEDEG